MNYMMKLLSLLSIVILISSCTTPAKKLQKAYNNDPVAVAKFCRDKFPCLQIANDTIINTEYQYLEVKCDNDTITNTDTLFITGKPKTYTITKTKFIATPSKTITITRLIKDSAEVNVLEMRLNECSENSVEVRNKLDRKNDWIKWLLIILCASLLLNVLFISNKK